MMTGDWALMPFFLFAAIHYILAIMVTMPLPFSFGFTLNGAEKVSCTQEKFAFHGDIFTALK